MSGMNLVDLGNQPISKSEWRQGKRDSKDFSVATPTEFVKKFGGDYVINKVIWGSLSLFLIIRRRKCLD